MFVMFGAVALFEQSDANMRWIWLWYALELPASIALVAHAYSTPANRALRRSTLEGAARHGEATVGEADSPQGRGHTSELRQPCACPPEAHSSAPRGRAMFAFTAFTATLPD